MTTARLKAAPIRTITSSRHQSLTEDQGYCLPRPPWFSLRPELRSAPRYAGPGGCRTARAPRDLPPGRLLLLILGVAAGTACAPAAPEAPGAAATISALQAEVARTRATATAAAQERPALSATTPTGNPPTVPSPVAPRPAASPAAKATQLPITVDPTVQAKAAAGTAERVVRALQDSGLPVGDVRTYTAENDPDDLLGRPGGYLAKAAFRDSRLEPRSPAEFSILDGGIVEVWPSEDAARTRHQSIRRDAEGNPDLVEYAAVKGPVLLRISRRLTPDQAAAYETALNRLGSG